MHLSKCKSLLFFLQSLFYPVEASFADTRLLAGFIDGNIFVFIKMKGEMIFFQSFFFYSFGSSDEFLSSPCSFDSCFRSFTDEISFKLSYSTKNLNDKLPIGRSSIKSGSVFGFLFSYHYLIRLYLPAEKLISFKFAFLLWS